MVKSCSIYWFHLFGGISLSQYFLLKFFGASFFYNSLFQKHGRNTIGQKLPPWVGLSWVAMLADNKSVLFFSFLKNTHVACLPVLKCNERICLMWNSWCWGQHLQYMHLGDFRLDQFYPKHGNRMLISSSEHIFQCSFIKEEHNSQFMVQAMKHLTINRHHP